MHQFARPPLKHMMNWSSYPKDIKDLTDSLSRVVTNAGQAADLIKLWQQDDCFLKLRQRLINEYDYEHPQTITSQKSSLFLHYSTLYVWLLILELCYQYHFDTQLSCIKIIPILLLFRNDEHRCINAFSILLEF